MYDAGYINSILFREIEDDVSGVGDWETTHFWGKLVF